jgi:hypothetical protein
MTYSVAVHEGHNYLIYCTNDACEYAKYTSTDWGAGQVRSSHFTSNTGRHRCKIKDVSDRRITRDDTPTKVERHREWVESLDLIPRIVYEVKKRL